jgi:hypothetical protein
MSETETARKAKEADEWLARLEVRVTMLENYIRNAAAPADSDTPADTLAWRAEVAKFAAIGEDVAEQARALFEDCGEPDDYCHQTRLVFGGVNRIKLTRWGWRADAGHCTNRFYDRFAKLVTK